MPRVRFKRGKLLVLRYPGPLTLPTHHLHPQGGTRVSSPCYASASPPFAVSPPPSPPPLGLPAHSSRVRLTPSGLHFCSAARFRCFSSFSRSSRPRSPPLSRVLALFPPPRSAAAAAAAAAAAPAAAAASLQRVLPLFLLPLSINSACSVPELPSRDAFFPPPLHVLLQLLRTHRQPLFCRDRVGGQQIFVHFTDVGISRM